MTEDIMKAKVAHTVVVVLFAAGRVSAQEHAHPEGAERLGTVHFSTSCSPAVAPQFDRGVALLHSFEFGASIRAFNDVLAADSTCAMAYWGLALSRWTNPFVANNRTPAQLSPGREAINNAARVSGNATDRERAYIAAAAQLFADYENVNQRTRIQRYADAMAALSAAQPQDTEAQIFYALSLAAAASPTDKTYANQRKAGAMLESLFVKQPTHPGLAHYIIHSYDYPPLAKQAARAADQYAGIAPSAAHALHMPSHTFTRVGMWEASVSTNRRSREVALSTGSIAEALHAMDYSMYALLQLGQDSAARSLLDSMPAIAARLDLNAITGAAPGSAGVFAIAAIPARWALERRAWTEAAALQPHASPFPNTEAMTYFARTLGAAHTGNLVDARAAIDSLSSIQDRLTKAGEAYWAQQVRIQRMGAQAWVALAERRSDQAIEQMRQAALAEDSTEKSAVTPGPLLPARELLADMYMEQNRPAEALKEYRATLEKEPNRFRALYGAQRAATLAGDHVAATQFTNQLRQLRAKADRRETR